MISETSLAAAKQFIAGNDMKDQAVAPRGRFFVPVVMEEIFPGETDEKKLFGVMNALTQLRQEAGVVSTSLKVQVEDGTLVLEGTRDAWDKLRSHVLSSGKSAAMAR